MTSGSPAAADAVVLGVLGADADDAALRGAVDLVLASPLPMSYAHGPELRMLYNAAFAELLGTAHPAAYGAPAAQVLGDVWQRGWQHGADGVVREGRGVLEHVDRGERTWTRSHSPVRAADGRVTGILTVAVETTQGRSVIDRLGRLAAELSEALTLDDVVRALLRHAVAQPGPTYARVWLEEPARGGWTTARRLAADVSDPAAERLPLMWSAPTPRPDARVAAVAERGEPVWLEEMGAGEVAPPDVPTLDGVVELDAADRALRSVALLPLGTGPDGPRGLLSLGREVPGPFSTDERALMTSAAALAGRALVRARLFEEQRGTGWLLQRSLLPDRLPAPDGVLVEGRHEPASSASAATEVGGAFYDAVSVGDGRLALLVGDVVGRGVPATVLMGQARAALRALALVDPSPSAVLHEGDRVFRSLSEASEAASEDGSLTLVYALVDLTEDCVRIASAGHPTPVLRRRDGSTEQLACDVGPPLGVPGERPVTTVELSAGDLLVLYSDGLLERPGETVAEAMGHVVDTVAAVRAADPFEVGSRLLDGHDGARETAVLALGRTTAPHSTARTTLPGDATAPRTARSWLRAQLRGWHATSREDDLEAALTEVVTNVVLHAGTSGTLTARHGEGRVWVEVVDRGRRGEAQAQDVADDATRGRGLTLVDGLVDAWGVQRTTAGHRVWFEVHDGGAPPA
ncbi:SpoIIE family protein phosphatase [Aquipuribacter sp. SD81]|uniref:SpoIIE family protein phosphatase n=1 Tax=Aquipuribacter sp. SD81 TaxID=3127703 RepID=UPI003019D8C2